jgi:DNA-binding response OmpR family regulator
VNSSQKFRKVLIIDDDDAILEIYSMALQELGLCAVQAQGALEGLEKTKLENIELIIVDYRMPGMSGVEFVQKVRSGPNKHIPILMVTAGRDLEFEALNAGADRVLEKPFDVMELLSVIGLLIDTDHTSEFMTA